MTTIIEGTNFYNELRDLRDQALERSYSHGTRWKIGNFAIGCVDARWRNEEGGQAQLSNDGIVHRGRPRFQSYPTTLKLTDERGPAGQEVTTYRMDLDQLGMIAVFHSMITTDTFMELCRAEFSMRKDRDFHELTEPTQEDLTVVYRELQRGASGEYATPRTVSNVSNLGRK